jgi:hypothetical protein
MTGIGKHVGSASQADARIAPSTFLLMAIWLLAVAVAVFFAMILRDSTIVGDLYIPRTNDSFYHARRILDAAVGERGFYQFDDRLHVPDGSWISWPWAYDYLIAKATQLALWIRPGMDPMAFIVHIPVAWILVNAALFQAATGALGLSLGMRALAMLGFALSPLTQLLHGIGMIDHHYVEHTFVLLNIWLGLRWLKRPDNLRWAAALGAALGAAPGFHNGLFMLQLIPLGSIFVLWLRGNAPPLRSLVAFCAALLIGTQLMLLPSEPYRSGMFEFGLLSWFHFYVACGTAGASIYMGWRPFSQGRLVGLAGLGLLSSMPAVSQLWQGATFMSSDFSILEDIVEARSPYTLFTDTFGPTETASYYSWLLLAAPVLLLYYGLRLFKERRADRVYYAVAVTFGLAMMFVQFRFYYYGLFALITGGLLIVDRARERFRWHGGAVLVTAFAVLTLAYQPALRERLFTVYAPGGSPEYASTLAIFLDLAEQCADDPGTVLASNDDGNAILFHTECSVIANNFILRPQDEAKINEIDRLMRLSPEDIRQTAPQVKYLFLRARDFSTPVNGVERLVTNSSVARELFLAGEAPEGFTLIRSIERRPDESSETRPHARLYKIEPVLRTRTSN